MAPTRLPNHPPTPVTIPLRRDAKHLLANGFSHDQITTAPTTVPPREIKGPTAPPSTLPVNAIPATIPRPGYASTPTPVITSVPLPGRPHATQSIYGSLADSRSRNGTSSSASESESDSNYSSTTGDVSERSKDDYAPAPRRFPYGAAPVFFPTLGRSNTRPPTSWHVTAEYRSSHSQSFRSRQVARSASQETGSAHSEDETGSISTGAERQELWTKVDAQRQTTRHLRARLAQKRKWIRALRHKKDETDNAFMQLIRSHLASAVVPISIIEKRFGEMQSIRDDYYSAESTYEAMEQDLDLHESELRALEADLFRLLDDQGGSGRQASSSASSDKEDNRGEEESRPESRISLLGISSDRQEDIHPLYQQLLDTAGDRELAREHYDDLQLHRDKILDKLEIKLLRVRTNQGKTLSEEELIYLKSSVGQAHTDAGAFRAQFGVTLDEDDLDFLRDFEAREAEAKIGLEESTRETERLRHLCIEQGVMRKHPSYNEEFTVFLGSTPASLGPDGNMRIDDPARPGCDLTHPIFPTLLSNPSHVLDLLSPMQALTKAMELPKDRPDTTQRRTECMKELGIANLMKKVDNKPDYINQWLIHRLRTSPMEAELALSVAQTTLKIKNIRRWQEDVLFHWRQDEAAQLSPDAFRGPQTPRDELGIDDDSGYIVNSVIAAHARPKSEDGGGTPRRLRQDMRIRPARSLS
ncbi:hypothetical protein B0T22DRAFT_482619 [Podospora appendiculata]|uniref:Uncharacterized protein n=1 Tax=Podospora appendiculata TaxID=314037 RepID=A0AAE1CAM6_9PEZI|nr:hypothetical protein B0T22DRAFT_482619 [Podospora appendiculata]